MTLSSLGDLSRSFTLRNQTTVLKSTLERRSSEVTTGRTSDVGRSVRGDFSPLNAIDTSLARLDGHRAATTEATLLAGSMQSALSSVASIANTLGASMLAAASPGNPTAIDAVGRDAQVRFGSAVATLNSRIGDRTVFAGTATRSPALAPPDTILDAVMTAAAGATTASDVEAAIAAWFDDPAGYATLAYLGGPPLDPQQIAPGEQVSIDTTAGDPAIRDTLRALALGAVLDRGILAGDTDQRARLARRSGETLLEGSAGRTALAARIGSTEERIATAETRNSGEATALRIARLGIVAVDPYEAATALTEAESQLDTLYAITSRLSRLSLANYL